MLYEEDIHDAIDFICDSVSVDSIPFYHALEWEEGHVSFSRQALDNCLAEKEGMDMREFWNSNHTILHNTPEEIEGAIELLKAHFGKLWVETL